MSQLKAEKFWDIGCDICAKHLSTDFGTGMLPTAPKARQRAKEQGFKMVDGYNLCPNCHNEYIRGNIKLADDD